MTSSRPTNNPRLFFEFVEDPFQSRSLNIVDKTRDSQTRHKYVDHKTLFHENDTQKVFHHSAI